MNAEFPGVEEVLLSGLVPFAAVDTRVNAFRLEEDVPEEPEFPEVDEPEPDELEPDEPEPDELDAPGPVAVLELPKELDAPGPVAVPLVPLTVAA